MLLDFFQYIQPMELALIHSIQSVANPILTLLINLLTYFGDPLFWMLAAAFLYWSGRENKAFYLANLLVFISAVSSALKISIARPRPETSIAIFSDTYGSHSFPSGHSSVAGGIYGFYSKYFKNKALSWFLLGMALLTGFTRIYLGLHYLTDVIFGLLIGYVVGILVYKLFGRLEKKNFRLTHLKEEIGMVAALILFILALIFLVEFKVIAGFLAFYAGFFIFKELDLKQEKLKLHSSNRKLVARQVFGFAVLFVLLFLNLLVVPELSFIIYGIIGLWISIIYPYFLVKTQLL